MWANVNRRGNYNRIHVQPGATWTGAYIVDTGHEEKHETLSGVIGLINPNLSQAMSFYRNAVPTRYIVQTGGGVDDDLAQLCRPDGASAHGQTAPDQYLLQREKDPYP